jgi:hypothetical protein
MQQYFQMSGEEKFNLYLCGMKLQKLLFLTHGSQYGKNSSRMVVNTKEKGKRKELPENLPISC